MVKMNGTARTLRPPNFSAEEQDQIVTDLMALKKPQIASFLARCRMRRSGKKEVLKERIQTAIDDGTLSVLKIVQFLDEVVPWGKQHVFLFDGPKHSIADWRSVEWLASQLGKHRLGRYLNDRVPLVLPKDMSLSSISHDESCLRITAIRKREWWERNPDYDNNMRTDEGDDVELRAFVHRVTRSLVAFEWDLVSNTAFLQISQLPRGLKYEQVAEEFFDLVTKWLDIKQFTIVDIRPAIARLHELQEAGNCETRSHGINYRTMDGRQFEGKSASPSDPLLGDPILDSALGAVRKKSVGHLGNFYWLSHASQNLHPNPLDADVHVIVIGAHNRINFPTPNVETTVRHVLSRVRSHCA